jgi:excisionase family DNA binding protein
MSDELLVSLDEAGRRLSLSRRSVQGLIYSSELRSLKIGRCRRIAVTELEAYVERLRRGEAEALAVVGVGAA